MADSAPSPRASTARRTRPDFSPDLAAQLDRGFHVAAARTTGGLSPISLALAAADWGMHLAGQPAQNWKLAARAQELAIRGALGQDPDQMRSPLTGTPDRRFSDPAWRRWPYSLFVSSYHAAQVWWAEATDLPGMEPHHRELVSFMARQWLDMLSPSNSPFLNPEVIDRTLKERGANLFRGAHHYAQAVAQAQSSEPADLEFLPGEDVALTPGRVVFRNHLVELLQYEPTTKRVAAEPVFIVPSWIMKYYILDLSPHNSMVKWLVGQGRTVFILSWRNPDADDADLTMDDYLQQGVFEPLMHIAATCHGVKVQAAGYCLGGTLLAIGAAALARTGGVTASARLPELSGITLLATEVDFSEPGELGLFIDESQVRFLEELMSQRGYLTGPQMGGSFTYLHARDQVWSKVVRELLMGEPTVPNDLMSWNADVTRMPARMHAQYLRSCYLHNAIANHEYLVEGQPVALQDVQVPMFVLATETDHVSPWKSVYKIHRLADTDITFALTSGGHNAGVVSEPGHRNRRYAIREREADGKWISADAWLSGAEQHDGSWWPAWNDWLTATGSGKQVAARRPSIDDDLGPAPGRNVQVRYADPSPI